MIKNLLILSIVVGLSLFSISQVSAEKYVYNMTETEVLDEMVTEVCIKLQINSEKCDMVYGSVTGHTSDGKIK